MIGFATFTEHCLAALVPEMAPHEFAALVADVTMCGLLAGTGTYGLAALDLRREFIGVEAGAGRFTWAVDRLGAVAS